MRLSWIVPVFVGVALWSCNDNAEVAGDHRDDALFVQNAQSGSFNGKEITLEGVSPTIFFSQKPDKVAGSVSLDQFKTLWIDGQDTVADTTKGTLKIQTPQGEKHVTVELMNPQVSGGRITYKARVVLGNIPRTFGSSTLFIDFGKSWRVPQGETL